MASCATFSMFFSDACPVQTAFTPNPMLRQKQAGLGGNRVLGEAVKPGSLLRCVGIGLPRHVIERNRVLLQFLDAGTFTTTRSHSSIRGRGGGVFLIGTHQVSTSTQRGRKPKASAHRKERRRSNAAKHFASYGAFDKEHTKSHTQSGRRGSTAA